MGQNQKIKIGRRIQNVYVHKHKNDVVPLPANKIT